MSLSQLTLSHFRNIVSLDFKPSQRFNLITGDNGAGKTSVLESIYYLSCAKSFKTRYSNSIIQNKQERFTIFGQSNLNGIQNALGISRNSAGEREIVINKEKVRSTALLSYHLPTLLITTTSYRFFHDGPKLRRQFIDWGAFHQFKSFLPLWKDYQNTLKQRNASLKFPHYSQEIKAWDPLLAELGNKIDIFRREYVQKLNRAFSTLISRLLPEIPSFQLRYQPGWRENHSLIDTLTQNFQQDIRLGYTTKGPHKADLNVLIQKNLASEHLSQGQQKLTIVSLKLAKGLVLSQTKNQPPVYLIDDLSSELDSHKIKALLEILEELEAQVFISSITKESILASLSTSDVRVFHMKHGKMTSASLAK